MSPLRLDTIADHLLAATPALADIRDFSTYGGQLAITIFLGNTADYVLDQTRALARAAPDEQRAIEARLAAILEIVERALVDGDDRLQGAVSAAFIEELDTDDAALFRKVLARLGPTSREEVRVLTKFYHSKEWQGFLKNKKR